MRFPQNMHFQSFRVRRIFFLAGLWPVSVPVPVPDPVLKVFHIRQKYSPFAKCTEGFVFTWLMSTKCTIHKDPVGTPDPEGLQTEVHSQQCPLHIALCTLPSAPCPLHIALCTLHSAPSILHPQPLVETVLYFLIDPLCWFQGISAIIRIGQEI